MFTLFPLPPAAALLLCALAGAAVPALAEKADRSKPMTLESDQPCTVNLQKQTSACSGNVSITQGTMQIRADRLELRETAAGHQLAQALGGAGKPAVYRQKRDGLDEIVEGQALMGLAARITEREQSGRTVYRVRLGPFEGRDEAEDQQARLAAAGIDANLVRVER